MTTHIVMVSGGKGSFEAARRVIERYGANRTLLWFADTKTEDSDLYRFLKDAERVLGVPIQRFADGRDVWQVFRDVRYLGNHRIDPCSDILKRKLLRAALKDFDPDQVVIYLGLDWTEAHRVEAARRRWNLDGWIVDFPLTWEPYIWPDQYVDIIRQHGIEPPRLYALGFEHNNCGGTCVKAGLRQWAHVYRVFPDRYLEWERKEQELREYLGADVAILDLRRDGKRRPLTLREFREKYLQPQTHFFDVIDAWDEQPTACSCFADPVGEATA